MAHQSRKILDKLDSKLDQVVEVQIRMEQDLKYHIKRTDILEEQVKPMNKWFYALKILLPALVSIVAFKDALIKLLK